MAGEYLSLFKVEVIYFSIVCFLAYFTIEIVLKSSAVASESKLLRWCKHFSCVLWFPFPCRISTFSAIKLSYMSSTISNRKNREGNKILNGSAFKTRKQGDLKTLTCFICSANIFPVIFFSCCQMFFF